MTSYMSYAAPFKQNVSSAFMISIVSGITESELRIKFLIQFPNQSDQSLYTHQGLRER